MNLVYYGVGLLSLSVTQGGQTIIILVVNGHVLLTE